MGQSARVGAEQQRLAQLCKNDMDTDLLANKSMCPRRAAERWMADIYVVTARVSSRSAPTPAPGHRGPLTHI